MTLKTIITNLYNNIRQDIKGERGTRIRWSTVGETVLLITSLFLLIAVISITLIATTKATGGIIIIAGLVLIIDVLMLIHANKDKIHERK